MEKGKDDSLKLLMGKLVTTQLTYSGTFDSVEASIFSQFGDDGIIQFLIRKIRPANQYFIEFGVEDYLESNTRFLMQNNNWSGLVLDGSEENVRKIKQYPFFWKHDLIAIQSFITAENINKLLSDNLPHKDVGLLHIDIDGNDYWVWKSIECIKPEIVIVEYNSVFGWERAITIPYHPDFVRGKHHYSNLYAGASLAALCGLAEEKDYYFIGSNSAGNNAYFVRKDKIGDLKPLSAEQGYVESKFRESRGKDGKLTYLRGSNRLSLIKGMKVYNTITQTTEIL